MVRGLYVRVNTQHVLSLQRLLSSCRDLSVVPEMILTSLTYSSATNIVNVPEDPSLGPTARTAERSLRSSNRELFPTTSSSEQISQGVHPIQIARTEDNTLMIEGVGVVETLVSSEISSSVVTLTAFKTIVLTTISTSMICTCNNSPLS